MSDLSNVLALRRRELGLTLAQIADHVGVTEATVQRWESGNIKQLRQENIVRLAGILKVSPAVLMGWDGPEQKLTFSAPISSDGLHIGRLYDRADEKDKLLTHTVLDKYDEAEKIVSISSRKKNPGGFTEIDVYEDQPAAAGLGNYLSDPTSHREQLPSFMVPKGADFGIRISGDSMEPLIENGATVFVKQTMIVESGKVGIFVLNGESYCKQLIVDRKKKEVKLHSINPKYEDIFITPEDTLFTIGQVL